MSTTTSPHPTVDADLELLSSRAAAWAGLPIGEKRALVAALHEATASVAREWARAACRAKGLDMRSPLAGEEWMSGPMAVLLYTTALGRTLDALAAGRSPVSGRLGRAPGGRTSLRVRMPFEAWDRLLLSGFRAELWMEPGVTPEAVGRDAGLRTRRPDGGGVGLVLGAGNIASIGPLDVLYKLFADGRVVLLKLNPVNDYLLGVLERAFAPFIEAGFVRIVAGGADLGGLPDRPFARRRGPPDGERRDARRDRLRDRGRRVAAQGDGRGPADQADDQRVGRCRAGDRLTGEVERRGPALPGRARGDPAAAQQRLQLQCQPGRHRVGRLAAEGRLHRRVEAGGSRRAGPAGVLPGVRRAPGPGAEPPPGGRDARLEVTADAGLRRQRCRRRRLHD